MCVRLACVKRAASVRSEPGSNSQIEPPITKPKPKGQNPATRKIPASSLLAASKSTTQPAQQLPTKPAKQLTYPRLKKMHKRHQNAACTSTLPNHPTCQKNSRNDQPSRQGSPTSAPPRCRWYSQGPAGAQALFSCPRPRPDAATPPDTMGRHDAPTRCVDGTSTTDPCPRHLPLCLILTGKI